MSGRWVDVDGVSPQAVIFSAATCTAYGDEPFNRVVLIAKWVATDNATVHEVELALGTARLYLIEDAEDAEGSAGARDAGERAAGGGLGGRVVASSLAVDHPTRILQFVAGDLIPGENRIPQFDDLAAVMNRAHEHLREFVEQAAVFRHLDSYTFHASSNPDSTSHTIWMRLTGSYPRAGMALAAGDCLHNMRKALDHAVYLAAVYNQVRNPPRGEGHISFPIKTAKKLGMDHLKGLLSPEVIAIIEEFQPHLRPEPAAGFRPLEVLEQLEARDKHRLVTVQVPQLHGLENVRARSGGLRPVAAEFYLPAVISEHVSTKVGFVTFDQPTAMEMNFDLRVCVPWQSVFSDLNADYVMIEIHREVWRVIRRITKLYAPDVEERWGRTARPFSLAMFKSGDDS